MILELLRYSSGSHDTLGLLFDVSGDRRFLAYTLEDEDRAAKVKGKTRIPAGHYRLSLRTVGGMHPRYQRQFPEMHKGMIWLLDVPEFKYIYIHIGNNDEDTEGCILVGNSVRSNFGKRGRLLSSTAAYKRIYPAIADSIIRGDQSLIHVIDHDTSDLPALPP